jgi:hypothetical protein
LTAKKRPKNNHVTSSQPKRQVDVEVIRAFICGALRRYRYMMLA